MEDIDNSSKFVYIHQIIDAVLNMLTEDQIITILSSLLRTNNNNNVTLIYSTNDTLAPLTSTLVSRLNALSATSKSFNVLQSGGKHVPSRDYDDIKSAYFKLLDVNVFNL